MNIIKKIGLLFCVGTTALMSACSFAPIGENKFDCNRKDAPREYCRNVRAVLESTEGAMPTTKYGKNFNINEYDDAVGYNDGPLMKGESGKGSREQIKIRHLCNGRRPRLVPW